jgi:outer membrane protein
MKVFSTFVGVVALLASFASTAEERLAVGYLDMRKVLLESKAGKKNQAELEKFVAERRTTMQKEEEKLKAQQESFEKEKLMLSDAQKQEKQKAFETRVRAYREMGAQAEKELNQKQAELTRKTLDEIKPVVAQVAQEEKLQLVIESTEVAVLYSQSYMNLTDKVMKKFDAKTK